MDIIKLLVEDHEISVNCQDEMKIMSPLKEAILGKQIEVEKYLIGHGVAIDDGILVEACRGNDLEFLRYLIEEKRLNSNDSINLALIEACREENLDIIKYLVENCGANVNVTKPAETVFNIPGFSNKISPLSTVTKCATMKYLIEKGAIIDGANGSGLALAAIFNGDYEFAKELLKKGCNFSIHYVMVGYHLGCALIMNRIDIAMLFVMRDAKTAFDNVNDADFPRICNRIMIGNSLLRGTTYPQISKSDFMKRKSFLINQKQRNRVRAVRKIQKWWIPICYDLNRESGRKMMENGWKNIQSYS